LLKDLERKEIIYKPHIKVATDCRNTDDISVSVTHWILVENITNDYKVIFQEDTVSCY